MLLCCRKSCCFKAVTDKRAIARCWLPNPESTGSGSPTSPAVHWDCRKGESWHWDAMAALGASTSLDGKQCLPGDVERWPSWHGFCTSRYHRLSPSAGDIGGDEKQKTWGKSQPQPCTRGPGAPQCRVNTGNSSRGGDKVLYADSDQPCCAVWCQSHARPTQLGPRHPRLPQSPRSRSRTPRPRCPSPSLASPRLFQRQPAPRPAAHTAAGRRGTAGAPPGPGHPWPPRRALLPPPEPRRRSSRAGTRGNTPGWT